MNHNCHTPNDSMKCGFTLPTSFVFIFFVFFSSMKTVWKQINHGVYYVAITNYVVPSHVSCKQITRVQSHVLDAHTHSFIVWKKNRQHSRVVGCFQKNELLAIEVAYEKVSFEAVNKTASHLCLYIQYTQASLIQKFTLIDGF